MLGRTKLCFVDDRQLNFKKLAELERGRMISFRDGEFSYRVIAAGVKCNSSSRQMRIGRLENPRADAEKWRQCMMMDTWPPWRLWILQLYLNGWQHIFPLLQMYHWLLRQFIHVCWVVNSVYELLYTEFPSRKTWMLVAGKGTCILAISDVFKQSPLWFVIRWWLFMLDAMPVNATFRSALLNVIEEEHPELWSRVRLRIMNSNSAAIKCG